MQKILTYLLAHTPSAQIMETVRLIFLRFLLTGISASLLIAVILILRFLLRGYRRSYSYCLWASIPLFCLSAAIPPRILDMTAKWIQNLTHAPLFRVVHLPTSNVIISANSPETLATSANSGTFALSTLISREMFLWFFFLIWIAGIAVLSVLTIRSSLRIRRSVRFAVRTDETDVWESGEIEGPFVKGLFRPRIYLPVSTNPEHRRYILLHERCHIRRKDNLALLLAQILIIVFWFQPLMWLARGLMRRDMEISCDEHATTGLKREDIADYSSALLLYGTGHTTVFAASMGNGRSVLSQRIRAVMIRKKKSFLLPVTAIFCCLAAISACFVFFTGTAISASDSPSHTITTENIPSENRKDPSQPALKVSDSTDTVNQNDSRTGGSVTETGVTPAVERSSGKQSGADTESSTGVTYEPGIISYDPETGITVWRDASGATVLSGLPVPDDVKVNMEKALNRFFPA